MPLLGKEPFVKHQLPDDISPEEQVFVCKATNEAFLTYDQFFERQILCSSMVWTCSVTNRTGLTYEEAIQSELNATEVLNSFPFGLQIPILYLMNYMNESKIGSIVDSIYTFINNRYFIAEEIEIIVNTKRKLNGKVFRVIPPSNAYKLKEKDCNIDPKLYEYEIIDSNRERHILNSQKIQRTKGVLTKDKIRLFLKQHLTADKRFQPMTVKESSQQKFSLNHISWNQLFGGPEPVFEGQIPIPETKASTSGDSSGNSKSNKKSVSENNKKNSSENKNNKIEDKLKSKETEKLEKEREREQKREWNTKRDDLACDDLRPLPEPVPFKCRIPVEVFSDTVFVMEFVHNFKELIDLKAIFPLGITFELMEQILTDTDIDGPFVDLIKVLLATNFNLLEDEDNSTQSTEKDDSDDEERHNRDEERNDNKCIEISDENNPIYYYQWIQNHFGFKLSEISLDAFTITEVLRLYLLSSGAGIEPKSKYRGLYNSREDPAIEFVNKNEEILNKLKFNSVFDLKPAERLKIFDVLIHQLLSYFEFRDKIDDSFEEMTKLRKKIRDIQIEFNKWTKDNKPIIIKNSQNESQTVTTSSTTEEINEFNKEKSIKEEEKLRDIEVIRSQIIELQSCYGLKPIGTDRAFRKYWIFQSLPGLFVQHIKPDTSYTNIPFGPCLSEPTPISTFEGFEHISNKTDSQRDDSSTTSDKENESNSMSTNNEDAVVEKLRTSYHSTHLSRFDRCTANVYTCAIHGLTSAEKRTEWGFYYTSYHLSALMESLNNRGFRESELKFALNRDKNIIMDYMNRCQPYKLNTDISAPEARRSQRLQEVFHSRKRKNSVSRQTFSEAFVTTLKEDLIILEEKLFAASLAVVTDMSRTEWRKTVERDSNDKQELIDRLSKAIISLKESIRSMCLSVPLSEETSFQNWSQSLCQSSSLSQLFVHLSILDDSIKWSKSAREAYCKICRRKCDAQNMLLCDQCNRGHHTYCLQPSLDVIPRGEWFCPDCCPKFKPQTPKKDKKYSKLDEESDFNTSDDEDMNESDVESDESVEPPKKKSKSRSTTPSQEVNVCEKCRAIDSELQLSCAECHQFYHLECANVTRVTRSDWFCHKCSNKRLDQKKRKQNIISINFSEDSQTDEESNDSFRTPKKSRYSRDFDYINGKGVDEEEEEEEEEEEKIAISSSTRRLNRKGGSVRNSLPLDYGLCEEIIKKLQKHSDGWLFMSRPKQAPNYNKIIHQYMDFGQLVSKLNSGKYSSNSQFFRDVLLMLSNATFYNQIDSEEYQSCQSLAQYFQQLLGEYGVDPIDSLIF